MSYLRRFLNFFRSLPRQSRIEAFKSSVKCALWKIAAVALVALFAVAAIRPPIGWLPEASEAVTLLGTLLTAQAAIAALTLAVTLFVMQGVGSREDVDDRMYRAYVGRSSVRSIFWISIIAVAVTGATLLAEEFISRAEAVAGHAPGLPNLTLLAAAAFFANLVLACVLFQRAIQLAHPTQWRTLRRNVNERDVREAVHAFLSRRRRALSALESNEPNLSSVFPDPEEGSADEAIRALLDDARRAMAESRLREFKESIESIKGLITYAMKEIEDDGIVWGLPGGQPQWPPLRELGRNLYSFREVVIRDGNRDHVFELLSLDYWVMSTGARRRCGDLFSAGLEGYRNNYRIASRIAGDSIREILRDRVWINAAWMIIGEEPEEVFPYALEMVQLQERLLSDAMHNDEPDDFEKLHKGFEASLRLIRGDWERRSWSAPETVELSDRLEQEHRIVLMGLAGRAINLAESGRISDATRYLEVGREAHSSRNRLAEDIAQAFVRDDSSRVTQWSEWQWEGAEPGKAQVMNPEQYPLTFLVVRLMELSSITMPALNLHGRANRVLGWFETNAERLLPFVSEEPTATKEERRLWAAEALRASVPLDETAEEDRIISSNLSPERVSLFKSDVYASAFAARSVEQLFDQAGAFLYISFDSNAGPEERGFLSLVPKGFLAELPAGSPVYYGSPGGDRWGRGLADDITNQLCKALDRSPEISLPLDTPEEFLLAFEMAKKELDSSDEVVAVLAGNWTKMEIALNLERPEGYVPAWQIPNADQVAELGRYHGHSLLSGPRDSEPRLYLVEPSSWGCFVRAQCRGGQDLRIDVNTISAERAQELLNGNPNHFSSEPDEESKLLKLQTLVELEIRARIEFRVKNPFRARRVVQSGLSTPPAPQWRTRLLANPVSRTAVSTERNEASRRRQAATGCSSVGHRSDRQRDSAWKQIPVPLLLHKGQLPSIQPVARKGCQWRREVGPLGRWNRVPLT